MAKNKLDEWINFFKNEVVNEGTKAKGLTEALEKLDILKLSKEEKLECDRYVDNWRIIERVAIFNSTAGEMQGGKTKQCRWLQIASKRECLFQW